MLYSVCLHLPLPVWDYIFQQQVHGPHRSPGKRFNRYNSDKNHYLLFEELNGPLIIRTEVSFTQRCVETRLKLANWFWRRKVLNFIKCIFAISTLSLLEKRRTQHLNELESYFNLIRGFFVLSLVEIEHLAQVSYKRTIYCLCIYIQLNRLFDEICISFTRFFFKLQICDRHSFYFVL